MFYAALSLFIYSSTNIDFQSILIRNSDSLGKTDPRKDISHYHIICNDKTTDCKPNKMNLNKKVGSHTDNLPRVEFVGWD